MLLYGVPLVGGEESTQGKELGRRVMSVARGRDLEVNQHGPLLRKTGLQFTVLMAARALRKGFSEKDR